jgi:UrcA family protein
MKTLFHAQSKLQRRKPLVASLSIALLMSSSLLCAAESTSISVREAVVRYSDLDVTKPAGAAALQKRIRAAAWRVCDDSTTRELWRAMENRRCSRDAEQDAIAQLSR